MAKKIFLLCLAAVLLIQGAAFAKKKTAEIPMSERIKVAVDITDSTNFIELDTAEILRSMLIEQLDAKKIFNIVNAGADGLADIKSLGDKKGSSDVGEMLIFNPVRVTDGRTNPDFDRNFYRSLGAQYVIHCDILGLGTTREFNDSYDLEPSVGIGIGSGGNFGFGVFGGVPGTKRTVFGTVVNMQFVDIESGAVVFRYNLIGQELRRKKPSKGYDDASDEAYLKSIKDSAAIITKRVNHYAEKHLLNREK